LKHSKPKQNRWEDHYSRKAKKERFPARSVYKLKEIQQKYHLIKRGDTILDLGCSPGSWLLYAADMTGHKGRVVGIDLKTVSIKIPPYVEVYTGDILLMDDIFLESIGNNFNVVLSDMAPNTSGNKFVDGARSFDLCQKALFIAQKMLVPGGSFVCKIFQGEDFRKFSDSMRACFGKYRSFKPQSSRKASREIYLIGLEKKTEGNDVGT
jgi:23S rRNA (uridine2552-2'-O)-methyltransferase